MTSITGFSKCANGSSKNYHAIGFLWVLTARAVLSVLGPFKKKVNRLVALTWNQGTVYILLNLQRHFQWCNSNLHSCGMSDDRTSRSSEAIQNRIANIPAATDTVQPPTTPNLCQRYSRRWFTSKKRWNTEWTHTLQGINISHLGKRKIIFKMPFLGDMLVPGGYLFKVCLHFINLIFPHQPFKWSSNCNHAVNMPRCDAKSWM